MDSRAQFKIYLDIAVRRWLWVVVPTIVGLCIGIALPYRMTKLYRAETTILVTRQSVPQDLVRTTVALKIDERMKTLRVQVLSDTYLDRIVKEFRLVEQGASEADVERARSLVERRVGLDWDKRDFSYFTIAYTDTDPVRAAGIANMLAGMFIEQNTKMRAQMASGTRETVAGWSEKTKKELEQRDSALAAFKKQYMRELPDQQPATIQLLNNANNRVDQLSNDLLLKNEQLNTLKMEAQARRALDVAQGIPLGADDPDARALAALENELADLLVNYTDENPLVKKKLDQIARFKALHPNVAVPVTVGEGAEATSVSPAIAAELSRLRTEIRILEEERQRALKDIEEYKTRLNNMPLRQQQLTALTRDYETLKKEYDEMRETLGEVSRSQDLEESSKGEQFQVQDKARPPAVPFSPQPLVTILMGLGIGLGVGVGIAALFEFLDSSLRSEEAFAAAFPNLPVVGLIPNLDAERKEADRRRRRRRGRSSRAAIVFLTFLLASAASGLGTRFL